MHQLALEVTSGYVHRVSEAARHMDALWDGRPTKPASTSRRQSRSGKGQAGDGFRAEFVGS
jgi:hypothetical protein